MTRLFYALNPALIISRQTAYKARCGTLLSWPLPTYRNRCCTLILRFLGMIRRNRHYNDDDEHTLISNEGVSGHDPPEQALQRRNKQE